MGVRQELVRRFRAAVEKAFSERQKDASATQLDFDKKYQHLFRKEYDSAIAGILKAKDADTLDALMQAYLALYSQYAANTNNVHFYRSDQLFMELFTRSTKVPVTKRDLFAEWAGQLASPPMQQRFIELTETPRSQIRAFIAAEADERRKKKSILDYLRDEYSKQFGTEPRDVDLYGFNPYPSDTLKGFIDGYLKLLGTQWDVCFNGGGADARQGLHTLLGVFRGSLKDVSNQGHLQLFQVLKHLQDRIRPTKSAIVNGTLTSGGDSSVISCEMYAMACLQLLVHAQTKLLLAQNRRSFSAGEQAYLARPLRETNYRYESNLEKRLGAPLTDVAAAFDQTTEFLDLVLQTKNALPGADLVDLAETLRIEKIWADIFKLTEKFKDADDAGQTALLKEPANAATLRALGDILNRKVSLGDNAPELSKGVAQASRTVARHPVYGDITVIYIDPKNDEAIYVEFEKLRPNLFLVRPVYLATRIYETRVADIYRSTVGIVYVTQFLFAAVGFLPAFVEGGFAALLYEIVVYYGSTKVEEQAAKIHPLLGKVAGLATQILAPRPHFGPKINDVPVEDEAFIIDSDQLPPERDFDTILDQHDASGDKLTDFQRGTGLKGLVAKAGESAQNHFQVGKQVVKQRAEAVARAAAEILPQPAAVTPAGIVLRVADEGGVAAASEGGSRATGGRGIGKANAGEAEMAALETSAEYKSLAEYRKMLTPDQWRAVEQRLEAIRNELKRGAAYAEARQKVTNLLNGAKEVTGEYVADSLGLSNYRIVDSLAIPVRRNGVPMLDRVYKVEAYGARGRKYLFAEIKGGRATRLGNVTKKIYVYDGANKVLRITELAGQRVRQASPEWYYQKIIEIYEAGHEDFARELFGAAIRGEVESVIVKSSIDMEPFFTFNSDEIIAWFKDKKLPYDR